MFTVDTFLSHYKKQLVHPEFYFGVDNNQNLRSDWDIASLRILICFLGTGYDKQMSLTYDSLDYLLRESFGKSVFVDKCYFPEKDNVGLLQSNNIPFLFGNVSHRPVQDYDILMVVHSILSEAFNLPLLLHYSGIPLTIEQRNADSVQPLIFFGGSSAIEAPIIFGNINDDVGNSIGCSLVDIAHFGVAEGVMEQYIQKLLEYKEQYGSIKKDKVFIKDCLINDGVCLDYLFYPDKYRFNYADDNFTITSIDCLDDRLPNKVKINRYGDMSNIKGFPRKIFNLGVDGTLSQGLLISNGCAGQSNACSFQTTGETLIPTKLGLKRIDSLVDSVPFPTYSISGESVECQLVKRLPADCVVEVTLSDGSVRRTGLHHKMIVFDDDLNECVVESQNLKEGDKVLLALDSFRNSESVYDGNILSPSFFSLLGYLLKSLDKLVFLFDYEDADVDLCFSLGFLRRCESLVINNLYKCCDEALLDLAFNLVYSASDDCIRAFLEAFISLESCSKHSVYYLFNVNINILFFFQKLFRLLGFPTYIVRGKFLHRLVLSKSCLNCLLAFYSHHEVSYVSDDEEILVTKGLISYFQGLLDSYGYDLLGLNFQGVLSANFCSLSFLRFCYGLDPVNMPFYYKVLVEGRAYPVSVISVNVTDIVEPMYTTLVSPTHRMCYDMVYEHNCFDEHSVLFTDRGCLKIKDVVPNLKSGASAYPSVSVSSFGDSNSVGKVVNTGRKLSIQVVSESGYSLITSYDHTWIVIRNMRIQEVLAKDLLPSDFLIIQKSFTFPDDDKITFGEYKKDPIIPSQLKYKSKNSIQAFISLIFDKAFSLNDDGVLVYKTSHYLNFIEMRLLLSALGVFTISYCSESFDDCSLTIPHSESLNVLKEFISSDILVNAISEPFSYFVDDSFRELNFGKVGLDNKVTYDMLDSLELPKGCFLEKLKDSFFFIDKVSEINNVGLRNCYDIVVNPSHLVNVNGIISHNCMEASVAGNYTERSLSSIEDDLDYIKSQSAMQSVSFFAYNLNYYSRFMDLMLSVGRKFKKIMMTNQRLDVIARSLEPLKLAKYFGLKRLSGAVEGIGSRIRNKILNKNLSRQTLMQAFRNIISLNLMQFKMGFIYTGLETADDIADFFSELDEMLSIKKELGSKLLLRLNITPLVVYNTIPLRWLSRRTAIVSFMKLDTIGDLIKGVVARGLRLILNGGDYITYMEQLLVDFGPIGTDWLVHSSIDNSLFYYGFYNKTHLSSIVGQLAKRGYSNPLFFTDERPSDWIFPVDFIDYASLSTIDGWYRKYKLGDYSQSICLRTSDNDNAVCSGCGVCKDTQEIVSIVDRDIISGPSYDEAVSILANDKHAYSVRLVYEVKAEWDIYHKTCLSYYVVSRFLARNKELNDAYYGLGKHSLLYLSTNGQNSWYSGRIGVDVQFKQKVSISAISDLISAVNSELSCCQVVNVIDDVKDSPLSKSCYNSYFCVLDNISFEDFSNYFASFDWSVRFSVIGSNGLLCKSYKSMLELRDSINAIRYGSGILVNMILPCRVNPYYLLGDILHWSDKKVYINVSIKVLDTGKYVDDMRCSCDNLLFSSMLSDQVYCPICNFKHFIYKAKAG